MAIPIYTPGAGVIETVTNFTNQSVVNISHNLSYKPRIIITDTSGAVIFGDIIYYTNSVSITFVNAITGTVYIS